MSFDIFEKSLGHVFHDKSLLHLALTHSSHDLSANNERLEFLGDRVLGLLIADLLHHTFPNENEGALARRHTALVQEPTLAKVARKIELAKVLKLSDAERKSGGADKSAILADALEALIAALYLDQGLEAARQLVLR